MKYELTSLQVEAIRQRALSIIVPITSAEKSGRDIPASVQKTKKVWESILKSLQ